MPGVYACPVPGYTKQCDTWGAARQHMRSCGFVRVKPDISASREKALEEGLKFKAKPPLPPLTEKELVAAVMVRGQRTHRLSAMAWRPCCGGLPSMQSHFMLCHAMQRHAMPCHAMQRQSVPHPAMQRHVAGPCHTMQHETKPRHAMPHSAPCHVLPRLAHAMHAMPCHAMQARY